jgi:predicted TIM-barrel fold metal-dependent hydrolase
VVDSNLQCDREFFATAVRLDHFIMPTHRTEIRNQGRAVGVQVHCLEDWEEALRRQLGRAFDQGAVVVKHGLAYLRSLHYDKPTRAAAESDFAVFFRAEHAPEWRPALKAGQALQNHMMHALLRLADQQGLTVQVHTGLQEGNGNVIADANPVNLTNCFLEYENVTFDLFHMGYPYTQELSNLAKNFRNVSIDMCWGHIISPEAARRALTEWLDAVPANKIIGFGGDYCFVDGVYGHQQLARDNIATVLAAKVADGSFDMDRAREIARWLLVDNPTRILRLNGRTAAGGGVPAVGA